MCGITGYLNKSAYYVSAGKAVLSDALYMHQLRGIDALGIMRMPYGVGQPAILVKKDIGRPLTLLRSKDWEKFVDKIDDSKFVVCHNRLATRGAQDQTGAHPFTVYKPGNNSYITLVHNGTLHHIKDEKKWEGVNDSHSLAKLIASGMSLEEVQDHIFGAWACVWYDSSDRSLNFWRNKERPFSFVESKKDVIWFGSEPYVIAAALERNKQPADTIMMLPEDQHWKWDVETKSWKEKRAVKKSFSVVRKESPPASGPASTPVVNQLFEDSCDVSGVMLPEEEEAVARAKVVPFPSHTMPHERSGGFSNRDFSHKNYHSARSTKIKWGQVNEAFGLKTGGLAVFSLYDYSATKRPAQVEMVGNLVNHISSGQELVNECEVIGMFGQPIAVVDEADCLFCGKITEISCARIGKVMHYRMKVKKIKMVSQVDPFRNFQRDKDPAKSEKTSNDNIKKEEKEPARKIEFISRSAVPQRLPNGEEVVIQGNKLFARSASGLYIPPELIGLEVLDDPAVPNPKADEKVAQIFEQLKGPMVVCDDCGKHHWKKHVITEIREGQSMVNLTLCSECFPINMADSKRKEEVLQKKLKFLEREYTIESQSSVRH